MNMDIYEGLPTISLLPVNTIRFSVVRQIKISLPKTGFYGELELDLFSDDPEEAGEFDLFKENSLDIPGITKVLLATGKYPKLNGNQLFTLSSIAIEEDCIALQGSILDIIGVKGEINATETPI